MNDNQIVEKFINRDESAISDAKSRYEAYCMAIAENILHNVLDAEECVSDAMMAAWKSIPLQRPADLKTYLGKLTREKAIDMWRRRKAQKRISKEACVPFDEIEQMIGDSDVASHVETAELASAISDFLRSLKENERNVFVRKYWYCDSTESICKRFGYGKSKTLMMLKRTRDRLAEYLKKEGFII